MNSARAELLEGWTRDGRVTTREGEEEREPHNEQGSGFLPTHPVAPYDINY